jgi:NAD(P)-dependent dehydrogenase (short-subunit alcohol dehydrogenase family)
MIAGAVGRGRQIINISSTAGESARTGAAHYCGSKAALNMLTKVLAIELAPHGIRVNAVAPGIVVDRVYQRDAPPGDPYVAALLAGIPLGRTGMGDDIAKAVSFLISPEAEWITGEILHVNGGSTAGRVSLPPSQF